MTPKLVYGKHCFAEFSDAFADTNSLWQWCIMKIGSDWCYYLEREEDAMELMRRVDAYEERVAERHPMERGI